MTTIAIYDAILGMVPGTLDDAFTRLGEASLEITPARSERAPGQVVSVFVSSAVTLVVEIYSCRGCGALVANGDRQLHVRSHGSELIVGYPDGHD